MADVKTIVESMRQNPKGIKPYQVRQVILAIERIEGSHGL